MQQSNRKFFIVRNEIETYLLATMHVQNKIWLLHSITHMSNCKILLSFWNGKMCTCINCQYLWYWKCTKTDWLWAILKIKWYAKNIIDIFEMSFYQVDLKIESTNFNGLFTPNPEEEKYFCPILEEGVCSGWFSQ